MGAKSPPLSLLSPPARRFFPSKPTKDLEYRKRGNSVIKIGRKPGSTWSDYVTVRSTFVSHSLLSRTMRESLFRRRVTRTSIISFRNVCVLST